LVVCIHVNYPHGILSFGCNTHVKSERTFGQARQVSIIDYTTNVLGLGSGVFFLSFFFRLLFIIRQQRSCRGDRFFLYRVVTCWMHYKLLRVMLGGSTEIKLTAEYKQESKGNRSQ